MKHRRVGNGQPQRGQDTEFGDSDADALWALSSLELAVGLDVQEIAETSPGMLADVAHRDLGS